MYNNCVFIFMYIVIVIVMLYNMEVFDCLFVCFRMVNVLFYLMIFLKLNLRKLAMWF